MRERAGSTANDKQQCGNSSDGAHHPAIAA
jgi:hypothetical protein